MSSLRRLSFLGWGCLAGLACTSIEYASGGSGNEGTGAGGTSTSSGGAPQGSGGIGAGPGGEAGTGPGGGPGSGGDGGCLGPDACDGTDGDCDGWADDPPGDTGLACGCYWGIFDGRRYAACPFATYAQVSCPPGMQVAVPQSAAEQNLIGGLGAPTVSTIMVGLTQSATATSPSAAWSWVRPGVPIVWAAQEPNDWASGKPSFLETGAEQCGDIKGSAGVNDNLCEGGMFVACEEIADECLDGAPCELALGCEGEFDCTLSADQCVASPVAEQCDGRDNDCNGLLDDGNACNCAMLGATYKVCGMVTAIQQVHCGEGWSLATLETQSELNILVAQILTTDPYLVGLLQQTTATGVGASWRDRTGTTPNGVASYWAAGEPNDDDDVENHVEDCSAITAGGLIDQPCEGVVSHYICELD